MLKEVYDTEFEPAILCVVFEVDNPIPIYGDYDVETGELTLSIEVGSWVDDLPEDEPILIDALAFCSKYSGHYESDKAVNDMLRSHGISERLGLSYS